MSKISNEGGQALSSIRQWSAIAEDVASTLKGDHLVEEFQVILDEYVQKRYGQVAVWV